MAKKLTQADWDGLVAMIIERKPFTPGRGMVIVARDLRKETHGASGIVVAAEKFAEEQQTGTIVAFGVERENAMGSPVDFVYGLGDRVIIHQMAGKRLTLEGLEMAVLPEDEIVTRTNEA